jgi:hypothetical protein
MPGEPAAAVAKVRNAGNRAFSWRSALVFQTLDWPVAEAHNTGGKPERKVLAEIGFPASLAARRRTSSRGRRADYLVSR